VSVGLDGVQPQSETKTTPHIKASRNGACIGVVSPDSAERASPLLPSSFRAAFSIFSNKFKKWRAG